MTTTTPGPRVADAWFSARELAEMQLPGLPQSDRGIQRRAQEEGWKSKPRPGKGGGFLYHAAYLPWPAQAALEVRLRAGQQPVPPSRAAIKAELSHAEAWAWFDRQPDRKKAAAKDRLDALEAVARLVARGTPKVPAMQLVAAERGVRLSTLYNWDALVRGIPAEHRLPRLAPRHAGAAGPRAEASPEALVWLSSHWLSSSRLTVETCLRDLRAIAPAKGWALPSNRTLRRHLDGIDRATATYWRKGPEAADRLFPMLRRDRSALHALEMVNCDGHKLDILAVWPDGTRGRPVVWPFQDLYSGKWLAWRVDRTENKDLFRLAFGDMVERWGIPDRVFVDNTLAAANKMMSGGARHRFRFKLRDEDPVGIMPALGVEVSFTKPYSGQSKPIERSFGDIARDVSRHPAFEGAYLGSSPEDKPHNAGTRAIPIAEVLAVLEQRIAEHNARPGRQGGVCRGRSFDQVFADSYATAPIRKATAEQRQLFLLAAESVTVRGDSTLHLLGNRYHDAELVHHIGRQVVMRFDPDRLHAPVHVYDLDGRFLCTAECWADTGFADTEAARRIAQAKKLRRRGVKLVAEAAKVFEAEQLARDIAAAAKAAPPEPETKVVRPLFRSAGNTALKQLAEAPESDPDALRAARDRRLVEALRAHHGTTPFRVVSDDED